MEPAPGCPRVVDGRQGRTWQFTKTKLCKFHIIGMCVKGVNCPFAHDKEELRPLPDLTCTKLCKTLIQTGSCEDRSCTYAHTKDELRATSAFHKTKLCRFSQIGHCALGSKCNFAHSPEEVRPLEDPAMPLFSPSQGLYSDQPNEAALLLQQHIALASQQRGDVGSDAFMEMAEMAGVVGLPKQQLQYLAGLGAAGLLSGSKVQESLTAAPASAQPPGSRRNGLRVAPGSGRHNSGVAAPPLAARTQLPVGTEPHAGLPQRRRGGRRGRDARQHVDRSSGVGTAEETEGAESGACAKATATAFDGTAMTSMAGLDWITRQGSSMPGAQGNLAVSEVPFGGSPATFGNTQMPLAGNNSEDFNDSPAYVREIVSDFVADMNAPVVVKNTFLEFGPIGGPLRPVRSAAGRLDILGSEGPEEGGSVAGDCGSEVVPRTNMTKCYFSEAAAPGSGNMPSDCMAQAGYNGCEGSHVEGRHSGLEGTFTVDQKDDVWQVKNTFLTWSPQTKPIRSVKTAEGALCTLDQ
mmetsp:Transcript_19121/g.45020  ORF Transcript_19121/g.45020 Transcript_19121/m.45020 type:complete len:521 (-) Transcript_19121:241-1803(-)